MLHKTIAVCITGYNWENETRIVDGIRKRCAELDINVMVFHSFLRKPDINSERVLAENVVNGETEIFNLINYDLLDGIVVLGTTFLTDNVLTSICAKAKAKDIPVVNASDPSHTLNYNILLSDKTAMEFAVRHLITEHHAKKINFIGGFPGNRETEERLAAYKRVLEEYDIPFEEKRVGYGEFWMKSAGCTAKFLEYDKPDAIVCANDTMAYFAMEWLRNNGYKVPEDILVTGFDGIAESEDYTPSLTTVKHAVEKLGLICVDTMMEIWQGKDVPQVRYVESELIARASCGCKKDNKSFRDKMTQQMDEKTKLLEFNTKNIEMDTRFAGAETSAELYDDSRWAADYFKLEELFICICSTVEKEISKVSNENVYNGISKTMVTMLDSTDRIQVGTQFDTAKLTPVELDDSKGTFFVVFSPIYFKNDFLGYLAYRPTDLKLLGDLFTTWALNLANNAGSFYMKNQLEYVVTKLENLYVRDPLTNLYNRRGMNRFGEVLINKAFKKMQMVTVFSIDIDNLKPINDNYGHIAGDNAICQAANAIKEAMPEGSVCCRTGGDEFCAIVSGLTSGKEAQRIEKIEALLAEYNKSSAMPYKVECSCGFNSADKVDFESMENMITLADIEMYKVKTARKAIRR